MEPLDEEARAAGQTFEFVNRVVGAFFWPFVLFMCTCVGCPSVVRTIHVSIHTTHPNTTLSQW